MANPEHVEIVKQGADAIADWRQSNSGTVLDLEGADLSGLDLRSADLTHAFLVKAELREANLTEAILDWADLGQAKLRGALLENASLSMADLTNADLGRANLRASLYGSNLSLTNLDSADLRSAELGWANLTAAVVTLADFDQAMFYQTGLGDIDLSTSQGLKHVLHNGPSIIDERTLRKSWPLPEIFLRGVGLSDQYIEYLPSLMGQAIEFYSCFISYSSKDDDFARRLHADLQTEGVRCWFAPEDLRIGDKFRARIDEAIRLHDKLLLILSEDSVNSTWVEDEVESALEKERRAKERGEERTVLFPIRLDSAVMDTDAAWAASVRRTRHIGDFSDWKDHDAYKMAFERLLRDLKSGAKEGGNGES